LNYFIQMTKACALLRHIQKILLSAIVLAMAVSGCAGQQDDHSSGDVSAMQDTSCCSKITRELLSAERLPEITELAAINQQKAPEGMVYIPGGLTWIGSETGLPAEQPVFKARVEPFYMDKHLVTVGQFREFAEETGYTSFSEQIGDGIVYDFEQERWVISPGVTWEYPLGRDHEKAPDNHPATLLTNHDAVAYLSWAGKRLPTEIEWEHAARGIANRDKTYAWGDKLVIDGKFMANTWVGDFPRQNRMDDGYLMTSPVGAFGETELGLTDMGGNVWEWTSSWFRPYQDRDQPFHPGPESEIVLRGGSFMCHESYCHGYRVSARSNTPPDNNMFHIGFRGVRDVD
jgi:formylglycine-generating enzyme